MKVTINVFPFLMSVLAFTLAYMTITYKIDDYIQFAGEANALGFFIMASTLGLLMLVASFEKSSKKSS
jgi:hypothetical protein